MSIIKLYPENVDCFSMVAHPHRTFSSSSAGITGSAYVFPRRSTIERSAAPTSAFLDSEHDDVNIQGLLEDIACSSGSNKYGSLDNYMAQVGRQEVESRRYRYHNVLRFVPTTEYTKDTARKLVVKDSLMRYYRVKYPTAHWAYTNYNCLSFFTASNLPEDAALLYPNVSPVDDRVQMYGVPSGFTFDFRINPCHISPVVDSGFKAGTILHLSSSYALSLVSGSRKDGYGRPAAFRLKLQLSHSANAAPSVATLGGYPNDLVFLSDDNVLDYNKWHHVVIRWGTSTVDAGTGSFMVDSGDGRGLRPAGTFIVPSASLGVPSPTPGVLCVGNFYEGSNSGAGNSQSLWFSLAAAEKYGVVSMNPDPTAFEPTTSAFRHPLNADIHDVSIRGKYVSDYELSGTTGRGPTSMSGTLFYLGPTFLREAPFRRWVGTDGGILQSPFFAIDGTTVDPFNVALSFGVAGHDVNLENFVKDLANDVDPRLLYLTASAISTSTDARSCNEFLWDDNPACVKRNMLVMPCDDGNFVPNFEMVVDRPQVPLSLAVAPNESYIVDDGLGTSKYVDDLGTLDTSLITLDNMVVPQSLIMNGTSISSVGTDGEDVGRNAWADEQVGPTPESLGSAIGPALRHFSASLAGALADGTYTRSYQEAAPYTIYQRTKDGSSNEVVFFDISNLFYGIRITPKSFTLTDTNLSGSGNALSMVLKDDGYGNLYRATSSGTLATWNNVGNVFYDEGIVVIKSPHLFQFGKHQFEVDFKGEQSVHVMSVDVVAPANQLNSSSNPAFKMLSASLYRNDNDKEFVYISGINFHDENMNVVMKTQLAQPIMKRHGSRIMFKVKTDF